MDRPSKKDIKAALEKLKNPQNSGTGSDSKGQNAPKLEPRKAENRIRKKGV
ncbi:MAG TPA: hypothetical protein VG944_10330 [Fimbriimonas sp.]|nr:hypothetical protein [Fimbriimonas sp.]